MSRLKREGNPPSGQLASPVPQAWDPSINDFREITGQNLGGGRFGADGLQWGKTAGGLYLPIKVDNEGRQEVTLSGTVPPLVRVFERSYSGESGVDADIFWGKSETKSNSGNMRPLTVADYSEGFIEYVNNTNQTRRLFIYQFSSDESSGSISGAIYVNQAILHKSINVPAGTVIRLGSTVTVQQGEGLLEPEQLLNFYGVGFVIRTIWLNSSDVVSGTEKITFIARV